MSSAPLLPPSSRSRAALGLTAAAARGAFELQQCAACGAVQYPPREACHRCLSVELPWKEQDGAADLISETTIYHSNDAFFSQRLPLRVGLVRLDSGPIVVAHVHAQCPRAPSRVRVFARLDRAGQGVLVVNAGEVLNLADDPRLSEMLAEPKVSR